MRFSSVLILLLLGIAPGGPGVAGAPPRAPADQEAIDAILTQPRLELPDLFRLADLTSPRLAVARSEVEARAGRTQQAGLYPNPTLELGVEELFLDDSGIHKLRLGISQPVIVGGRRGAAVAAAEATLTAAGHQLQQTRRETLRSIHRLWAEQLYFREAEAAYTELLVVANRTLQIARTRFDARAAPESQVTRALLEVYELEVAQQQLALEKVRGQAEFAAIFGEVAVPLDRLAGSLDPDPTERIVGAAADATAAHPRLQAAHLQAAAAAAAHREARAARIPDLDLFFAYGVLAPIDDDYLEAGIALPLPLFDRNQGRIAESRALAAAAQQEVRIVANDLAVALAAVDQRHRMLHTQLDAVTRDIVPAAARGLDQAQEAYRVGRLVFLELVDAQRTLTDARLRTLVLRRDLALAEADLMSLLGTGPYAATATEPGDER